MARTRLDRILFVSALTMSLGPTALAQELPRITSNRPTARNSAEELICQVYSLDGEAGLVAWAAETIPAVIDPGTWTQDGGRGVVRYYAPRRTLVVSHTAATHAKVKAFLAELKGNASASRRPIAAARAAQSVRPAGGVEPGPIDGDLLPPAMSYSVPPPHGRPKHLFHFLIRYEGDGIVDSSVVDLMRVQSGQQSKGTESTTPSALAGAIPVVPTCEARTLTPVMPAPAPPLVLPVVPGAASAPRNMPPAAD